MGRWKRARSCGPDGGNCVEVAHGIDARATDRSADDADTTSRADTAGAAANGAGRVGVRDSAHRVLDFPTADWQRFLAATGAGRYDRG